MLLSRQILLTKHFLSITTQINLQQQSQTRYNRERLCQLFFLLLKSSLPCFLLVLSYYKRKEVVFHRYLVEAENFFEVNERLRNRLSLQQLYFQRFLV